MSIYRWQQDARTRTGQMVPVGFVGKYGGDGPSTGGALDKLPDMHYDAVNSRICSSLGLNAENRLSRLLMTLQRAAVHYVASDQ
jgi:hypothetical protein